MKNYNNVGMREVTGIQVTVQIKGKPRQELGDRNQSREHAGMMLTYWLVQLAFLYSIGRLSRGGIIYN